MKSAPTRSDEAEVRDALFGPRGEGFGGVVPGFRVANEIEQLEIYRDVLPAVLELESNLGHRWRQTAAVLDSLGGSAGLFPIDLVEDCVVPLTLKHLAGRADST